MLVKFLKIQRILWFCIGLQYLIIAELQLVCFNCIVDYDSYQYSTILMGVGLHTTQEPSPFDILLESVRCQYDSTIEITILDVVMNWHFSTTISLALNIS